MAAVVPNRTTLVLTASMTAVSPNRPTLVLTARHLSELCDDYVLDQSHTKKITQFRIHTNREKSGVLPFNVRQGQRIVKQMEKLKDMIHKLED